ncbi:MAG: PTS sugar transporter subunit IIA [Hyphomonadaceae bacterium]|nr:PTS sugar transporter subunit IIA [Hyphomonadaceae bacterium]MBX3510059.1 PTS sugar transporter subunit IIA [Hyphomonadaceae bacterium]
MIGVVVVSHGRLANEFVAAAEHVLGPQEQMRAVAIGPFDDMEERRADIIEAVRSVERGQGVVILTDMFGGTPSNLAISVINQVKTEVIAGVNLPMLIKLAEVRDKLSLADAALAAQDAGRRYIRVASVELAGGA